MWHHPHPPGNQKYIVRRPARSFSADSLHSCGHLPAHCLWYRKMPQSSVPDQLHPPHCFSLLQKQTFLLRKPYPPALHAQSVGRKVSPILSGQGAPAHNWNNPPTHVYRTSPTVPSLPVYAESWYSQWPDRSSVQRSFHNPGLNTCQHKEYLRLPLPVWPHLYTTHPLSDCWIGYYPMHPETQTYP